MSFAIIDFETTGLVPERHDRVVETAVVLTDEHGRIEHEWTTLVNPRRDVGASHIHGLTAADLLDAPEFADISDDLIRLVAGRTVVAHNASFDMRFLHAELVRAGHDMVDRPAAFCSMKWSGRLIGPAKLEHCCEALGIPLVDAHSALGDARAAAELMARLLTMRGTSPEWDEDHERSRAFPWLTPTGRAPSKTVRRGERSHNPHGWLNTVLESAWIPGDPEDEASYMLTLDRALLDRSISLTEGMQLARTAEEAGLTGETIARLHRDYLASLACEALDDGIVTDEERDDLHAVASALRLSNEDVENALRRVQETSLSESRPGAFALEPGDRVVFTGETTKPRDEWVSTIVAAGLASGGVTKSTKLLVSADPDSMSGKAAKARKYGIPVVGEEAFIRLFTEYAATHE